MRSRSFALLWMGQTISVLGDAAFYPALAWQVLILTDSGTAMGIVEIAQMIPTLAFLLIGGTLADRVSRRLILLWSDGGRAVVVLLIAGLGWFHLLQFWHLVALAFLFGIVDSLFLPTMQAIPPQLVEKEQLTSANALTTLSQRISLIVGPLLGAGFVAATGPAGAFAFDGLTFIFSVLCLLAIRLPAKVQPQNEPGNASGILKTLFEDVRDGVCYLASVRWLWIGVMIGAAENISFAATLGAAEPRLVRDVYGAGVWLFSVLSMANSIGVLVATLALGQVHLRRRRGVLMLAAEMVTALALGVFGLPLSRASAPVIASVATLVFGLGMGTSGLVWTTLTQELVPGDKMGRISSVQMLGSFGLMPLGLAAGGILTDRIGPSLVFIAGGMLNLLVAAVGLCVRDVRRL